MSGRDIDWIVACGVIAALEIAAVYAVQSATGAPGIPPFASYTIYALVVGSGFALVWFLVYLAWLFKEGEQHPIAQLRRLAIAKKLDFALHFLGFQVIVLSMAAFTGLKSMMTYAAPFWSDLAFADLDRMIFRTDPWRITHALFGPVTPLIDAVYALWVPFKTLIMVALIASPASRLKSQALISQALMWGILGLITAYAFSSAGPIYYAKVVGDSRFDGLLEALSAHPGLIAPVAAEHLWQSYESGVVAFGSGISAMPSLHVGLAVWTALILWRFGVAARIVGLAYAAIIFIGSVHLGWHYAVDGLFAVAGALLLWKLTGLYLDWLDQRRMRILAFA